MRSKKRFLTSLALEALTEKLANRTDCLLPFGRTNQKTTSFNTYAEMLNILLEVSQMDRKFTCYQI
jgi:hypothetical protein